MLKNPHNFPARKFALKAEKKDTAIGCDSRCGPHFYDIHVSDNCNAKKDSWSCLGVSYVNNTGLDEKTILTGSSNFTVKEIKTFKITN
jgi:hypothetical protein